MPYVPSKPARFRRFGRKFSSIGPDSAPGMRQFEELQDPIRQHNKFHSVVVGIQPPGTHRIAIDFRTAAETGRVLIAKWLPVLILIAHRRFVLLLSPFG